MNKETRKMNNQNLPVAATQAAPLPINSVQDMQTLGQVLAASNLFGKRNPAEGLAIVAMCQQKRISWLDFMQNFHMIQGVVSKKTDAIIADFHRAGGTHRVLSRTADKAECYFKMGDTDYTSTITWQDCLAEPFVYVGKENDVLAMLQRGQTPPLKAKYSTPRARMQMLWARCVSDGVRVVAPECVQGIYTPEETSDFVDVQPCTPSPTTGIATPAPSSGAPSATVQGVAVSPSPLADPSVCPCGPLMGKPWAEMETKMLQLALSTPNPEITTEMQDRIRAILAERERSAAPASNDGQAVLDQTKEPAND